MLERADDTTNEVLEPITFVLAYPNVYQITSALLLKYSMQYLVSTLSVVILRLKCDSTRAQTSFCLSAKRTSPFKSAGVGGGGGCHFSRLLAGELCTSDCRVCTARASMCSVVMCRLLVTHSILLLTWICLTRGYCIPRSRTHTCTRSNKWRHAFYVTRPQVCARITCCRERPLLCARITCCREL
jgi:hypothetical protein